MRRSWLVMSLMVVAMACDEPADPDAGSIDGGAEVDGGVVTQCERNADCPQSFCAPTQCMPGADGADARGCVALAGPCPVGQACDDVAEECVACAEPDADDDDHPSLACGGDDCDDDDGGRYPGGPEICDAEGHDEDCVETTFGDVDEDGDGYVSSACCNGDACGPDCDDALADVHPGVSELCNNRDDDCDGAVDEVGATPLCPGGTCTAGACSLPEWDRTFGGEDTDLVSSITMDARGNVYAAGIFLGDAQFGSDTVSATGTDFAVFVVSYAADGTYRWVRDYHRVFPEASYHLAYDAIADRLYVSLRATESGDMGHGITATGPGSIVAALSADGSLSWFEETGGAIIEGLAGADGAIAVGSFSNADFGDGPRTSANGGNDGFVVRYEPDGALDWVTTFEAPSSGSVVVAGVDVGADNVVVAGSAAGGSDFGRGPRMGATATDPLVFAVLLSSAGAVAWDYFAATPDTFARNPDVAFGSSGATFVAGTLTGPADLGTGVVPHTAGATGYVVTLDGSGAADDLVSWSMSSGQVEALVLDSADLPTVVGSFSGTTNFGGGLRSAPTGADAGFIVSFDAALNHQRDRVLTYAGAPITPCPAASCSSAAVDIAIGPADSTAIVGHFAGFIDLGSGSRASAGGLDGFIVRLAR